MILAFQYQNIGRDSFYWGGSHGKSHSQDTTKTLEDFMMRLDDSSDLIAGLSSSKNPHQEQQRHAQDEEGCSDNKVPLYRGIIGQKVNIHSK